MGNREMSHAAWSGAASQTSCALRMASDAGAGALTFSSSAVSGAPLMVTGRAGAVEQRMLFRLTIRSQPYWVIRHGEWEIRMIILTASVSLRDAT